MATRNHPEYQIAAVLKDNCLHGADRLTLDCYFFHGRIGKTFSPCKGVCGECFCFF